MNYLWKFLSTTFNFFGWRRSESSEKEEDGQQRTKIRINTKKQQEKQIEKIALLCTTGTVHFSQQYM